MNAYDKKIHLIGSFLVCFALSLFTFITAAAIITLTLGIAKELAWDMAMGKGTPEWGDIYADVVGIAAAVVVRTVM